MRSHNDPKLKFLRELSLFAGCSKTDLVEIAAVADEIWLAPGKRLTAEGARGEELMLILSGTASVARGGQMVATLGPGDVIGEIALLTDRPRTATVVATSPMRVLVISRAKFRSLVDRLPEVRNRLDALASRRVAS